MITLEIYNLDLTDITLRNNPELFSDLVGWYNENIYESKPGSDFIRFVKLRDEDDCNFFRLIFGNRCGINIHSYL